jgi:hypothetical protein
MRHPLVIAGLAFVVFVAVLAPSRPAPGQETRPPEAPAGAPDKPSATPQLPPRVAALKARLQGKSRQEMLQILPR